MSKGEQRKLPPSFVECPCCDGEGAVSVVERGQGPSFWRDVKCRDCNGTGEVLA